MIYDTLNNLPNYLGMSDNLDAVIAVSYTHLTLPTNSPV